MTEKLEIYKCQICGNVVQILVNGMGELVCCEHNMKLLEAHRNEMNELSEKHVPEIDDVDGKKTVVLRNHPMIEEHYIQFIQVYNEDKTEIRTKLLEPNEPAEFEITGFEEANAIELCNIHGLWSHK